MNNIVIIGASHAAVEVISTLRQKGLEEKITLIGDEASLPYQRPPLSKAYYKNEMDEDKLLLKTQEFYTKNNVELKLNCRATSIDRKEKTITLDNGETINYRKLILATGTRARHLPGVSQEITNIHYLRTKADVDKLKDLHKSGKRLLIVGAGYIGLEIAASAVKKGMHVTVLENMERVLARVTSPTISGFYQKLHKDNGVDIRLQAGLEKFTKVDNATFAVLASGEEIAFDSAIVGIGVIPNIELAENADLPCENGIIVDQYTKTEDTDIYAIGDCSNHPNTLYDRRIRLESVPNAVDQAKVAAANICGESAEYNSLPWFWSDQYDIKLQTAGLLQDHDELIVRGDIESHKFSVCYLQQGRLIAMDAINSPADFMMSKKLILNKVHPDPVKLADSNIAIKTLLTKG